LLPVGRRLEWRRRPRQGHRPRKAENGRLIVDPAIPHPLEQLELLDIPGVWGRTDAFGRAHIDVAIAA